MKTGALAAALKADILRPDHPSTPSSSMPCFLCGHRGPRGDASGRFCTDRCREAYDAGQRRTEGLDPFKDISWRVVAGRNPAYLPSTVMRRGPVGWYLACPGCQRGFESKGLRCCSIECERRSRERQENAELMAEVGMEVEVKRKCAKPGCDNPIPEWRNGRRVSKRARFCDRHSPHSRKTLRKKRLLDPKKGAQAAE